MNAKSFNIAFVDNDEDDRWLFQEAINELEIECTLKLFESAPEIMTYLNRTKVKPDFIFLDINMPYKNGVECLKEIKSNKEYNDIIIIIYASHNNEEHIDSTFNFGANLFIKKPSSFKDIKEILRRVLVLDWSNHNSNLTKKNFIYNPIN